MSNRKPKMPPPPVTEKENPSIITETRSYRLITPLYGGGVEPEKADPISVVRATEIRGHLRFWWRATRGGAYPTVDALRRAEEEIWGSAAGKYKDGTKKPGQSKVVVSILGKPTKKQQPTSVDTLDQRGLGYAAFPLRESDEKPAGSVWEDVTFTAEFRYDRDYKEDVEAALWAWETFGGIGARTRRGFGALQRVGENVSQIPNPQSAKEWLEENLNHYVVENGKWPVGVPHLSLNRRNYRTIRRDDAIGAWKYLITELQKFRQTAARYDKDSGDQSDYGMSHWPEANAIRRLFGGKPSLTAKNPNPAQWPSKFPRAKFGLPIVFHMAHDEGLKSKKITLQGIEKSKTERYDRLASPLILRPLACADGTVGLAAVLEWESGDPDGQSYTPPGGLILKGAPGDPSVKSKLTSPEAKQIRVSKIEDGQTDVLQAFLEYLKGK